MKSNTSLYKLNME